MNFGQIRKFDVANGPGIRTSLFVTGCSLNCPGCFNKSYQSFQNGTEWTKKQENLVISYLKNEHVSGLSVLGGEPLLQDYSLNLLLERAKTEVKKPIWLWTGFCFEQLTEKQKQIIRYVDVLVDGPFKLSLKNLNLKFRGSSNQRIIDLNLTRQTGNIVVLSV